VLSLAVDYFSKAIVDSKVNPYSDTVSCSTAITHPYAQVTSPYLAQGDRGARASNARAAKMAHEPPRGAASSLQLTCVLECEGQRYTFTCSQSIPRALHTASRSAILSP